MHAAAGASSRCGGGGGGGGVSSKHTFTLARRGTRCTYQRADWCTDEGRSAEQAFLSGSGCSLNDDSSSSDNNDDDKDDQNNSNINDYDYCNKEQRLLLSAQASNLSVSGGVSSVKTNKYT